MPRGSYRYRYWWGAVSHTSGARLPKNPDINIDAAIDLRLNLVLEQAGGGRRWRWTPHRSCCCGGRGPVKGAKAKIRQLPRP